MGDDHDGDARNAILARRARFIGLALMGTTTVSASACACLDPVVYEEPDAGQDAPADAPTVMDAPSRAEDARPADAPDAELDAPSPPDGDAP